MANASQLPASHSAGIAALVAGAGAGLARPRRTRDGRRHRRSRVAQKSVAASVWAAASAAKVALAGASVAGAATGVKEGIEERDQAKQPRKHRSGRRPKVVVLGSGWGAATFLKELTEEEAQMYDITVVSPRNYFLYTPLLPACTMGSVEERSIVTPVRRLCAGKADYIEAKCESIDTLRKTVKCFRPTTVLGCKDTNFERFPDKDSEGMVTFDLEYDFLVYAVGAQTNDFNTPGVKEHAYFFKEMADSRKVRERITQLFETAALPTTTPEERDQLLSFVVVGGGPTGVEVAADLADFVSGDAQELYPKLVKHVTIRLINPSSHLLSTYDRNISEQSKQVFEEKGVRVMTGLRVTELTKDECIMTRKQDGEKVVLKYGCTVWAAGIKEHALTQRLKESLVEKNTGISELNVSSLKEAHKGIITDEFLQVRGSGGTIFALGDAATVRHDRTLPFAEKLFEAADIEKNGEISFGRLLELFQGACMEFPQLEEYAEYLLATAEEESMDDPRAKAVAKVFGEALDREQKAFRKAKSLFAQEVGDRVSKKGFDKISADFKEVDPEGTGKIGLEDFKELLDRIDKNLQPFPPTAQVAAQQGKFLAKMVAKGEMEGDLDSFKKTAAEAGRFTYFHKGSLAYLGGGSAAFDLPVIGAVTGPAAGIAWKLYETSAQLSWKNRAMVGLDWIRSELFGRDTSRI